MKRITSDANSRADILGEGRPLQYPRFDTAEAGARIFGGFLAGFTIISGVAAYVSIFVLARYSKFGGAGGWVSGTLSGAVFGAMLGGVLLLGLRITERWLPGIPRRLQLVTGALCGFVTAAGLWLPTPQSPAMDDVFSVVKIVLGAGIPSLFIILLIGMRARSSE